MADLPHTSASSSIEPRPGCKCDPRPAMIQIRQHRLTLCQPFESSSILATAKDMPQYYRLLFARNAGTNCDTRAFRMPVTGLKW